LAVLISSYTKFGYTSRLAQKVLIAAKTYGSVFCDKLSPLDSSGGSGRSRSESRGDFSSTAMGGKLN
jgi:hypothetical protein